MKKNNLIFLSKKIIFSEIFLLLFFIIIFILIRSINFIYRDIFTQDSATFAISSLEIWRSEKLTLIGPPISFRIGARYLFQGSITYYFLLLFLLLGKLDFFWSSYFFMIFCALMIIPLYFGSKYLLDRNKAIILVCLYSLLPFYINHTVFLWNSNFQFSLIPILILFMGLYKKTKKDFWFFLIAFFSSILLLFHYQFILIIIGLLIFYFFLKKEKLNKLLIFISGLLLGFAPIIVLEFKNQFYNLKTLFFFFNNFNQAFRFNKGQFAFHYLLSLSIFIFLFIGIFKKIKDYYIYLLFIFLLIVSLIFSLKIKENSKNKKDLNYLDELKVYSIIKKENLINFNLSYLPYDNVAITQKYFLIKDQIKINYFDYYQNRYLFVLNSDENFDQYQAYEIKTFFPRKILKKWLINKKYYLYLLERLKTN